MKEATYVAISTQKGGAGKTTLTVLVGSSPALCERLQRSRGGLRFSAVQYP